MNVPESLSRAAGRARQYRHLRTVAEIVGAVVLLSGGAAAAASVSTASTTGTTIHGCANTRTGALSVLLKKGAKCPRGTKSLSWNQTGPAGTAALFGKNTNKAGTGSGGQTCSLGEVLLTAGKTASVGTLPADGQTLSISEHAALFSLLGTEYGGNGTTTFALPNLEKSAPNGLTYSICATSGIFP
jgi:Phage Tail Collar Domain